ncbi:Radical SAM superfamily enzyme YgiQ, UPF0313 family [Ectothiorhodospira magna]|uniref:Radical SAM superfamily enzyme YgiQ, UPF0313 family n=1 Tax=Ectothiorhodospira magna TaxID=867345 RepID=A0A1H9A1L0_9GAMM|nr:radical SAM protein [Ectothiorhodospira magna]SEP70549.1 Radical SAM superfamily enzyme YgiQ, UPF0313 family [Ectothiorhodospira magna]
MRFLLVAYDNGSYIHEFPIGLGYIASVIRKMGVDVEVYSQNMHHFPDEHLTDYLDKNKFDFVGVGIIGGYYQYKKILSISKAINKSRNRPFYILGGHGPSPEPEFFLRKTKADCVVIGEGEIIIKNLINAIQNSLSLESIRGIAYWENENSIKINNREELIGNIDGIEWPAYDLFPIDYHRLIRGVGIEKTDFTMVMLSGRGCKFTCNFCYRMDEGFRPRSTESIIEEIKFLKSEYRINYIIFFDELLMSSVSRVEELCNSFIRERLNIKWSCNGRLNYAKKELLLLMKKAGCVFINYGIEAMDDVILKTMKKALTTKVIIKGIESTLEAGISPGYNIIFGNIGENRETLEKGVQFLLKYDDGGQFRTIRPVTPYPGSPLYYYAINKGLLGGCEDFYENKHLNSDLLSVNFTDMTDDEFHEALLEANKRLIKNYFDKKTMETIDQARKLYLESDSNFRGFRQT